MFFSYFCTTIIDDINLKILVTGGAGYIGSHFVRLMIKESFNDIVVLDNLSRGHREALPNKTPLVNIDLKDSRALKEFLSSHKFDIVIHFAAYAYVNESVINPSLYYFNNVIGSLNLIDAAMQHGCSKFIFSSTCSVYGSTIDLPIEESHKVKPINPYARTKAAIENILEDFEKAHDIKYISLRYFNAAGAHLSGEIGESHDPETHLIPLVLQTASGKKDKLLIYGDDYDTKDGTCVRDFIHVSDIAEAHFGALNYLTRINKSEIINLGTGMGFSILDIINKSSEVTNRKINYEFSLRREGDPAVLIADNKKAQQLLGWKPKHDIYDIINSAWQWSLNPKF